MACKYKYKDNWYSEEEVLNLLRKENPSFTTLYNNLLTELETSETGRKVFEQVKRDYKYKDSLQDEKQLNNLWEESGKYYFFDEYAGLSGEDGKIEITKEKYEELTKKREYTLEEQQDESIVALLGMMAADKLDAKKDATLISKLKELWKQISDFVKSLLKQDGIKIDELPITTTLNDLAEIMGYGNNKIILPGYKVEYDTPLGNKYDTLEEVNNEIRGLSDTDVEVDLNDVKIDKELSKEELEKIQELENTLKEEQDYFNSSKYQEYKKKELDEYNKQLSEILSKKPVFDKQEPSLDLEDKKKYGFDDFDYIRVESSHGRGYTNPFPEFLGEGYQGYYIHGYNTDKNKPSTKVIPITKAQAEAIWQKENEKYGNTFYEVEVQQNIYRLQSKISQIEEDSSIKYKIKNLEREIKNIKVGNNSLQGFLEKNKEYAQSKEIIEQWKKENNIQYDPEEVYSRGQGFYSSIGAYSNLELDLLLKNLIQHIQDNKKAGGEFTISAFTKPIDKRLEHIEGTGDRVRFVIYPKSEHIKWAAPTDVYSGSVWDAHEKVSKDKKSELLGVSFTKAPALRNINEVSPNLADIIDNLSHVHNEAGLELTLSNFEIEFDENIDYSTKQLINSINKILQQKRLQEIDNFINTLEKQC